MRPVAAPRPAPCLAVAERYGHTDNSIHSPILYSIISFIKYFFRFCIDMNSMTYMVLAQEHMGCPTGQAARRREARAMTLVTSTYELIVISIIS